MNLPDSLSIILSSSGDLIVHSLVEFSGQIRIIESEKPADINEASSQMSTDVKLQKATFIAMN